MNNLLDMIKSLGQRWKNMSNSKKAIFILLTTGIISSVILLTVYMNRVTYATLFSNLETQDSAKIYEKLKAENVPVKIQGNSILVPEEKVDELRMSVFAEGIGPATGKGWELFDQSKFGVTDTEARVMYQRALEGELSRTISTFEQVDKAIVHLVLPDETVFARETEKARASITIKLKPSEKLNPEQVKAIIALVSGSVKNLPKENVEVVDSNMTVLSENLFDSNTPGGTTSANKQRDIEKQFETSLEGDIDEMLGNVFGKQKVSVKVNADLDFDSKQITSIKYDPNSIVVSTKKLREAAKDSLGGGTATSPIDSQYTPGISESNGQSSDSIREEETTNYNVGQTEEAVVKAPGEVRRMTVSVVIDDAGLTGADKASIRNIVAAATGFSEERGDQINIEAMAFNNDSTQKAEEDLKAFEELEKKEKRKELITNIALGVGGAILLLLLILTIKKGFGKKSKGQDKPNLDVVIGDNIIPKQPIVYNPVLDDEDNMDLTHEIKDYANKKPDQVADLIKTWLSDDER